MLPLLRFAWNNARVYHAINDVLLAGVAVGTACAAKTARTSCAPFHAFASISNRTGGAARQKDGRVQRALTDLGRVARTIGPCVSAGPVESVL